METDCSLPHSQVPYTCPFPEPDKKEVSAVPRRLWMLRNMRLFYVEDLLALRPTTKLEDHTFSEVRNCLVNIFQAILHFGGHSSIGNLRTREAVVTPTQLSWLEIFTISKISNSF
jgi:hypothetical protein